MREAVIAGAGIAGSLLARELARAGMKVTVLEKNQRELLGHDWSDAVERKSLQEAGLVLPHRSDDRWEGPAVKEQVTGGLFEPHAIRNLRLITPQGAVLGSVNYPVILTDRRVLVQTLVKQAEDAGVRFLWSHQAEAVIIEEEEFPHPGTLKVSGIRFKDPRESTGELSTQLVVDASGIQGVLRVTLPEYSGMSSPYLPGDRARVYREVRQRDWQLAFTDSIPDHFQYGLHTGYRWAHQHHSTGVDLGAGVRSDFLKADPRHLVEELANRHPSLESVALREGEGCCILGPPLDVMVTGGFLVLGDAAGMAIPTTGSGVGTALEAALMAADVIIRACNKGDLGIRNLWQFNRRFYRTGRGAHLTALAGLRRFLQVLDHQEWEFLFSRGIIGLGHLEAVLSGRLPRINPTRQLPLLWLGRGRPALLWRTARSFQLALAILEHYQRYPLEWKPEEFVQWQRKARLLHGSICQLARLHQG